MHSTLARPNTTTPDADTIRLGKPVNRIPGRGGRMGGRPSEYWAIVADACRAHPGKWRKITFSIPVYTHNRYAARDIRAGRLIAFADGSWDATSRDGELWVRYNADTTTPDGVRLGRSHATFIDEALDDWAGGVA